MRTIPFPYHPCLVYSPIQYTAYIRLGHDGKDTSTMDGMELDDWSSFKRLAASWERWIHLIGYHKKLCLRIGPFVHLQLSHFATFCSDISSVSTCTDTNFKRDISIIYMRRRSANRNKKNIYQYPLVNIQKTVENHHSSWEDPLFQWQFSLDFCMFTRGYLCWSFSLRQVHAKIRSSSSPHLQGARGKITDHLVSRSPSFRADNHHLIYI